MTKVYRFTIANQKMKDIGNELAQAGIAGTIFESLGFWNNPENGKGELEPGITTEVACPDFLNECDLFYLIGKILKDSSESAAYYTIDGQNPKLLWASGRIEEV